MSAVTVTAKPSKADVSVGETFTVEVVATGPEGTAWTFPEGGGNETVELRTPPAAPEATPLPPGTHVYEAAVFAVTDVAVPPLTVRYRLADGTEGEASTEAVPLRLTSLLPRDEKEHTLADVRGPMNVTVGPAFWIALAAALLLAGALVYWIYRRSRPQPGAAPTVPAIPPDVEALAALEKLAAAGHLERGEYRQYYIELAEIAKRYLERRLGAPVLEMTSSEMVGFLRDHPHGGDLVPTMRDLAGAADQIKFARGEGMQGEAERHMAAARNLVAGLEHRLRPAPEPPPSAKVA